MAEAGKTKKGPKYPCLSCKKAVTKEHHSVQCQMCECWAHKECENITDEFFKILADPDTHGGACWNCPACVASAVKVAKMVKAFESRLTGLEGDTARNTTEIRRVDEDVAKLRKELEEVKAKYKEMDETRDSKYVSKEELRERDARKLNIIMHRVTEPGQEYHSGEERKKKDTEECRKIYRAIGLENVEIKHCRRIGERGDEPRPLVVVQRTEEAKRLLLENARELRDTVYSEVGIVPDMTVQQRREEQDMVEEANRRNEEELTDEDRAKNWVWMVVGPRGAKRLIKGVPRQYERVATEGGRGRGGQHRGRAGARGGYRQGLRGRAVTGANAAPLRTTQATTRLGPELLPETSQFQSRTGSKRGREEAAGGGEVEEGEEEESMDEEDGRSPLRKK